MANDVELEVIVVEDGPPALPNSTQLVAINEFLIDCSLSEDHNFESDITEYPVESGSNITDNIRPKPITVRMEGIVTNTPIGFLDTVRGPNSTPAQLLTLAEPVASSKPVDNAYGLLLKIREDREPVSIRTSLRTFENMALKSLSIPRDATTGDALKFTAEFVQIQIVTNKRIPRTATPMGTKNTKKSATTGFVEKPITILIDLAKKMWFDPDIKQWRNSAVRGGKVVDGKAVRIWNLYRSLVEIGDPFESMSTHGSHPLPKVLAVPFTECHTVGFHLKKTTDKVQVQTSGFAGASASSSGGI